MPSELCHLDEGNLYADGTFKAVKKLPFSQVFILSVKLGLLSEILVYPIIYCVMKHAREVVNKEKTLENNSNNLLRNVSRKSQIHPKVNYM